MESLIIVVHVIAAIALTVLVLLQRGKGAEMGASFGSGASQTLFGSSGSGNVLTKSTTIFATVFFITSLSLAVIARQAADTDRLGGTLIDNAEQLESGLSTTEAAVQSGLDEDVPLVDSEDDIPLAPE